MWLPKLLKDHSAELPRSWCNHVLQVNLVSAAVRRVDLGADESIRTIALLLIRECSVFVVPSCTRDARTDVIVPLYTRGLSFESSHITITKYMPILS
jgi:hypothetical protein